VSSPSSPPVPSGKLVQPAKPEIAREPLLPLPPKPTLIDVLVGRLGTPRHGMKFAVAQHVAQSAAQALRAGLDEESVLACLLHDIGMGVARPDHGWWGAQLIEPYVPEKVAWAVRYHQALRFFPDPSVGYEYPELYVSLFGPDYQPPEYIRAAYDYARQHPWYMSARSVTLFDDYSFDPDAPLDLDPFVDIIGRHFRTPAEGLGLDASPTSHMWRTIIDPAKPL
jgi:predicted HD phosphohydrolase